MSKKDNDDLNHIPALCVTTNHACSTKRTCFWVAVASLVVVALIVAILLWWSQRNSEIVRARTQMPLLPKHNILRRGEQMPLYPEHTIQVENGFESLATPQNGFLVASNVSSNVINLVNIKSGASRQRTIGDDLIVDSTAMSPDARTLVVAVESALTRGTSALQVWDLHAENLRKSISIGDTHIFSMLFDPSGKYVYCKCLGKIEGILQVEIDAGKVETVFGPDHKELCLWIGNTTPLTCLRYHLMEHV